MDAPIVSTHLDEVTRHKMAMEYQIINAEYYNLCMFVYMFMCMTTKKQLDRNL